MLSFGPRRRPVLGLAALLAALAVTVSGCVSADAGKAASSPTVLPSSVVPSASVAPSVKASPSVKAKPTVIPAAKLVTMQTKLWDGETVGVGMPIIFTFTKQFAEAKTLLDLTKVTVNGKRVPVGWYFEFSAAQKGYPVEGDIRPQTYWPAHALIVVSVPAANKSAGGGYFFKDSLTLHIGTGAANILTVNDATHALEWVSDGKDMGIFPVSLGATDTPTKRGIKVIMEKGASICMHGPGYSICGVKFTQRLTYDGEYLHAAPWNTKNIGKADSSNGCTNLLTADAKKLFGSLEIGDVVVYPNADGPKMQMGEGYGDWNVPWPLFQTGGLISTL
jgi:lipoprotein-anchoring transpeptidase ErfK/SrfK